MFLQLWYIPPFTYTIESNRAVWRVAAGAGRVREYEIDPNQKAVLVLHDAHAMTFNKAFSPNISSLWTQKPSKAIGQSTKT
jgi:hypothetical protein